jgi:hypothetical protein
MLYHWCLGEKEHQENTYLKNRIYEISDEIRGQKIKSDKRVIMQFKN